MAHQDARGVVHTVLEGVLDESTVQEVVGQGGEEAEVKGGREAPEGATPQLDRTLGAEGGRACGMGASASTSMSMERLA